MHQPSFQQMWGRTTSCIQMSDTLSKVCFCVTSYTAYKHNAVGQHRVRV